MEDFFEEPILKVLFQSRNQEFEHHILKKSKKNKEMVENIESKIRFFLSFIPKDIYQDMSNEIDEIMYQIVSYANFWNELFYKLGVTDGLKLDNETKNKLEQSKTKGISKLFSNKDMMDFLEYFEDYRYQKLINREDYKLLEYKKNKIISEFPNVRKFLEDGSINIRLNNDEKKAILEILDINERINIIELKEAYKLGVNESYR